MIILIILGILFLILLILFFRSWWTLRRIIKAFKTGNVAVFGAKGTGKDVLFNMVIAKRKDVYYSNTNYGGYYYKLNLKKTLELGSNTYETFIDETIEIIPKDNTLENHDIYISDCGVYFPSQMDTLLHKKYKSFPIFYALNRHLYNNGIHFNAQRLERVWKALREQSDYYILTRKTINLPFFLIILTTEYDKYETALKKVQPMKKRLFNKYSKTEVDKFNATNGLVKNGFIIIPKWKLKYDSRAFHEIMFGYPVKKKTRK